MLQEGEVRGGTSSQSHIQKILCYKKVKFEEGLHPSHMFKRSYVTRRRSSRRDFIPVTYSKDLMLQEGEVRGGTSSQSHIQKILCYKKVKFEEGLHPSHMFKRSYVTRRRSSRRDFIPVTYSKDLMLQEGEVRGGTSSQSHIQKILCYKKVKFEEGLHPSHMFKRSYVTRRRSSRRDFIPVTYSKDLMLQEGEVRGGTSSQSHIQKILCYKKVKFEEGLHPSHMFKRSYVTRRRSSRRDFIPVTYSKDLMLQEGEVRGGTSSQSHIQKILCYKKVKFEEGLHPSHMFKRSYVTRRRSSRRDFIPVTYSKDLMLQEGEVRGGTSSQSHIQKILCYKKVKFEEGLHPSHMFKRSYVTRRRSSRRDFIPVTYSKDLMLQEGEVRGGTSSQSHVQKILCYKKAKFEDGLHPGHMFKRSYVTRRRSSRRDFIPVTCSKDLMLQE